METSTYKVSYQGLRKKESYDDIVDYLENKQEKIKYPNRFATQIRNSPAPSNKLLNCGEFLICVANLLGYLICSCLFSK